MAILLTGAFNDQKFARNGVVPGGSTGLTCCDSGDGDACKPITSSGHTFTYNGAEYGLLKSSIVLKEPIVHLEDTGQKFNGDPIIINTSDTFNPIHHPDLTQCQGETIYGIDNQCQTIPNDEIVYVCRDKCTTNVNAGGDLFAQACALPQTSCFGTLDSLYDAYFRLSDVDSPGIPAAVKNCVKPAGGDNSTVQQTGPQIVVDKFTGKQNLQLETFGFAIPTPAQTIITWLSPWCKPAVYLYPEKTSYVSVKVNSKQSLTYTDPAYPTGGWNVLAAPSGQIIYQNKTFDYLYYETKAADRDIQKPTSGYVVKKSELNSLFSNILPKLGLNTTESQQFSEYWLKALPDSPYYFVGIVPQSNLNSLAALNINPKPKTEIRVSLYFETLKEKQNVDVPEISTPTRAGFTVVEWGGIFKKHPGENFSCIM